MIDEIDDEINEIKVAHYAIGARSIHCSRTYHLITKIFFDFFFHKAKFLKVRSENWMYYFTSIPSI